MVLCWSFNYQNSIFDFGLADSLPSFFYVIGVIFIIFSFSNPKTAKKALQVIVFGTAGALLYEFEQLSFNMVFDIKDVVSTILGGIVSFILYKSILFLNKRLIKKRTYQLIDSPSINDYAILPSGPFPSCPR
ncbi:hypothetical protein AAIE21_17300 [Paenibacillus sp. 102]|uniref:hypothetical protein n=1 Tax=Paenibacillus sp. 102 TaxID=3120823 RepID=UPI0031BB44FB